nr:unnamed protein product [Callosobruchus chinensis]
MQTTPAASRRGVVGAAVLPVVGMELGEKKGRAGDDRREATVGGGAAD